MIDQNALVVAHSRYADFQMSAQRKITTFTDGH